MFQIPQSKSKELCLSRRNFLRTAGVCGAAITLRPSFGWCADNPTRSSPIAVFSKIYQELKLGFEDAAAVTAAAGLDGIDCPVRAGGEILPQNAAEQLPQYAEILGRRDRKSA